MQLCQRLNDGFEENSALPEDLQLLLSSNVQRGKVRFWNQLCVWHCKLEGIQRLRCYPFRDTKSSKANLFHSKNQQDILALIPSWVDSANLFEYPSGDRPSFEIGRANLFFSFTLVPDDDCRDEKGQKMEPKIVKGVFFTYIDRYAEMAKGALHRMEWPHPGAARKHSKGNCKCF